MLDRKLIARALKFYLLCLKRVKAGHYTFSYDDWVNLHAEYGIYSIFTAVSKEERDVKKQIAIVEEDQEIQLNLWAMNLLNSLEEGDLF